MLKKIRPRVINCRPYRNFSNETFRVSLINNLTNEAFVNNDDGLEKFCKTTMDTLNSFAFIKKKHARDDQMPFMTKNLSKEIMTRSRLRNKYLKVQSCKSCNNKYMIASTQITNTEIFAFIAVLIFKLLSRKVLFINRKDNRNC